MQSDPAVDLLNRIAYSLSFGEVPKVQLPSRNKEFNRFSLLQSEPFPLYCQDLFDGDHMKPQYKNYLLERLAPVLRVATRSDFSENTATVQGPAEYFVLRCPDGTAKLLYMGPYAHVIGQVPTKAQLTPAKLQLSSATPSNLSARELAHLRQTRRPYGDMWS